MSTSVWLTAPLPSDHSETIMSRRRCVTASHTHVHNVTPPLITHTPAHTHREPAPSLLPSVQLTPIKCFPLTYMHIHTVSSLKEFFFFFFLFFYRCQMLLLATLVRQTDGQSDRQAGRQNLTLLIMCLLGDYCLCTI